jgi:hypothetical protein
MMLNRGAASVHAVDIHHACIALSKTATTLDFEITTTKVWRFELKKHNSSYDTILLNTMHLRGWIFKFNYVFDLVLNPGGMLIIEHSKLMNLSAHSHFGVMP